MCFSLGIGGGGLQSWGSLTKFLVEHNDVFQVGTSQPDPQDPEIMQFTISMVERQVRVSACLRARVALRCLLACGRALVDWLVGWYAGCVVGCVVGWLVGLYACVFVSFLWCILL